MNNTLIKDWLDNRDSFAVKRNSDNKLNWEGIKGKGSLFVFGDLSHISDERKLTYAYDIAFKRLIALGLSNTKLNLDHSNKTCGKVIHIDSQCMDDVNLTVNESLDVICGELVHEAAHVLYTGFNLLNSVKLSDLEHHIFNIIEDERIERLISDNYPGYIEEIAVLKQYVFGKIGEDPINKLDQIMHCFFHFVRYPKMINMAYVGQYESMLLQIKTILDPYPTTDIKVLSASREIAKILMQEFEKEENTQQGTSNESTQEENKAGTNNPEASNNSSEGNKQKEEETGNSQQIENPETVQKQDDSLSNLNSQSDAKESNTQEDPIKNTFPPKDFKECLDEIKTKWNKIVSSNDDKSHKENSKIVENNKLFIDEQDGVFDLKYGVSFTNPKEGEQQSYMDIKMKMASYIGKIKTKLAILEQSEKHKLIGLKSGRLDENKLVEALQGVDTVYTREEYKETNRATLVILVDESGSMSGRVDFMGANVKRIEVAKHMAIMLNEAFKNSKNVDLFIYGHTIGSQGKTLIRVYKEKGLSKGKNLTSMFADDYNRDGVAIDQVAKRVRKITKSRGLFLVLSDGQPSAPGYKGSDAIKHTKRAVTRLEQNRFIPIQVGIETKYRENPMFKNWIDFDNMDKMVKEFGNIVSKFIQETI